MAVPLSAVVVSVACLAAVVRRCGLLHPLTWIAGVHWTLGFGPLVGLLCGVPLFAGAIVERIDEAAVVLACAQLGLVAAAVAVRRERLPAGDATQPAREWLSRPGSALVLTTTFTVSAVAMLSLLASLGADLLSQSKLTRLATVGEQLHYRLLLTQVVLGSLWYEARRAGPLAHGTYLTNAALFVTYCVWTLERDFIFLLGAIAAHVGGAMDGPLRRRQVMLCVAAAVPMAVIVGLITTTRPALGTGIRRVLMEGTLMFVNTRTIDLVDERGSLDLGATYLNTARRLLPLPTFANAETRTDWFKDDYFPTSASGYGFALDAEAYLNFGRPGVIAVFFLVGVAQVHLFARARSGRGLFASSTLFAVYAAYALRNESLTLVKPFLYSLLCFAILRTVSRAVNLVVARRSFGACGPRTRATSRWWAAGVSLGR